ncbi:hypothetical protein MASR2M8_04190 [Opitutaceae bacterium]
MIAMTTNVTSTGHGLAEEFASVDLLVNSSLETRGIDAFALAVIKHERQLRRLVTYTVFQFPCFTQADATALRDQLAKSTKVYDKELMEGIEALWPQTLADVVGPRFAPLRTMLDEARKVRGKVFHGQITEQGLDRDDLFELVARIREWCGLIAVGAQALVGYDGFGRNSYRKGPDVTLHRRLKRQFNSVADFQAFLVDTLER